MATKEAKKPEQTNPPPQRASPQEVTPEDLDLATQKVITFLDTNNYVPIDVIGEYLHTGSQAYGQLRSLVYGLRSQGLLKSEVGSYVNHTGRVEKFALTREGERRKKELQGRKTLVEKLAASIFILFSLGILLYQEKAAPTGHVIGTTASTDSFIFLLSIALMIIGGVLFFTSFKKR